jgi:pimeloyl-ACP methyl ester carboxylesterase
MLIMGTGGSCRGWLPLQVPDFSEQHRTLIYDHPGVGGSEDPGGPFSIVGFAEDAVGLMDALQIERAHVLGVFMGGMVAQEVALRHPDRVSRLILAGTYARPDAKRRMLIQQWRDLSLSGASIDVMVRERLLWTLQDETLEQSDLIEAMSASFPGEALPISPDLLIRQCDACLAHDSFDRLHEIQHPTLLLCGRQDQLTPPKLHREMADEIPRARLVTLPYGAHLIQAESAERFNRVVLQFLAEQA